MKEVEFKEKGILYHLYLMVFRGIDLPKDTCTYRSRLIISAVVSLALLPLTIYRVFGRLIIHKMYDTKWERSDGTPKGLPGFGISLLLTSIPLMFGNVALNDILTTTDVSDFYFIIENSFILSAVISWVVGVIIIGVILGTVVGIALLITEKFIPWNQERIQKNRDRRYKEYAIAGKEVDSTPSQLSVLYKSLKEQYCKKITWV